MITRSTQRVVLVDDDVDFLAGLKRILLTSGFKNVAAFSNSVEAVEAIEAEGAAAILLDMVMPGLAGRDMLPLLTARYPEIPVIVVSAVSEIDNVVACMKSGAYDYLVKPLDTARLVSIIRNAFQCSALNRENRQLKEYLLGGKLCRPDQFSAIITGNDRMKAIFKLIETFAPTLHPILVTGETGAGKELVATVIHAVSGVEGPFVAINAGGVQGGMFTTTLFGNQKGGHSAGDGDRGGLIQKAQGGTLFLDEVGDLGHESQIALLRLLQEGEYYRPGSDVLFRSTARIIAASNRDLKVMIAEGKFRQDLFHRLGSHRIHIPPLRERQEDISLLFQHFAALEAAHLGKPAPQISQELSAALRDYEFRGNVRELINMVRNGVALNRTGVLSLEDYPELPQTRKNATGLVRISGEEFYTLNAVFEKFPTLEEFERLVIAEALKVTAGNKACAADILGITRPTLNKKLLPQNVR